MCIRDSAQPMRRQVAALEMTLAILKTTALSVSWQNRAVQCKIAREPKSDKIGKMW